jgi:hypothetical protein
MKLRTIALVLAVALASAAAHAQSGAYLTFDAQQFTQEGIYAHPGTHTNIDRPWLYGPGYGIYYDIHHVPLLDQTPVLRKFRPGPFNIGIDARGDLLRLREYGSQLDREDGIFSIRVSPKALWHRTTPYIQGGFGIGHTRIPYQAHYSNNFVFQYGIGVDRKVHNKIEWRMVEATAGFLGHYAVGGTALPNQSNYLVTLGTGLVFRIK